MRIVAACVLMFVAAVRGGAAGALPRDQGRIPVHVVGALALWGGGARTGSGGGRAGSQATVFSQAGRGPRGGARGAGVDVL